jgi:outer membrane protein assembly factor BamB
MSDHRQFSRITFLVTLFLICFLLVGVANAAPSITLSKKSGPPTSKLLVSGHGFKPNVGVDIYFGTKDEALAVTNGKGEFDDAKVYALRSARPGKHWVTALERNNDKGAQQPFLVQTNWSQFRFEADHEGVNPFENVLNPRTVGDLDLKWSGAEASDSSPAVSNGTVFFGSVDDGGSVYALDAETGAKLWSYDTALVDSTPAVADGAVYVTSRIVFALDARSGTLLWSYSTGSRVLASPAVVDGVVYISSWDNNVYALDARTGAKLWSHDTGDWLWSSPAIANGTLYVGSQDYNVYALDAHTGTELWASPIGGLVESSPAVSNGVVYVGSADDAVYALNANNGAELWSYPTNDYVVSSPAISNGVVYVGSNDGNLYALDAHTGAKLWSYSTGGGIWCSPTVANGVVYVGSADQNIYALNADTGALLWIYLTGGQIQWSSPAVVNGMLYVGSDKIYVFGLHHPLAERGQGKQQAHDVRPDLKTLRPDFNLKVSNR